MARRAREIDITKKLRESMTICYTNTRQCDKCIHYDDARYPECMQELIKDGCLLLEKMAEERKIMKRKIKRLENNAAKDNYHLRCAAQGRAVR